jgi:hypothetical protein
VPAVRQKLHLSPCADFRDRLLDRWDWVERDGRVIIDRAGPKTQETLRTLGGRMPLGGDEAIDEYFQLWEREMAKTNEVGTKSS